MTEAALTPAMRQWRRVKDQHPDKIVLFRMGDFYEMFGEDAREASELLEIALTTRDKGKADPTPMCGVPVHALDTYLGRLLKAGRRVVLCDQVEDPSQAKGLVRREVTRVVTPGTALEEGVVEPSQTVLLAAWHRTPRAVGLVWADLSSGDVVMRMASAAEAEDRLRSLAPAEILFPEGLADVPVPAGATATPLPPKAFAASDPVETVARRMGLPPGLPGIPAEPELLGALLAVSGYLMDQGRLTLRAPRLEAPGLLLAMDEATRRNLELVANGEDGGVRGSLLHCLDATRTPMGARLLRDWVLAPPSEIAEIGRRQVAVEAWSSQARWLASLGEALAGFPDLSRLAARFAAGLAGPRDGGQLRVCLQRLPAVAEACNGAGEPLEAYERHRSLSEAWRERLEARLEERLPHSSGEGGIFARGWNEGLDQLRNLAENAHKAILAVEARERERTGIASLKVRYNKVFGYFLEVSRANLAKVPEDYERRQTLVNAERFVTPELKELESRILSARADRETLEQSLWEDLVLELRPDLEPLREVAAAVGRTDVLAGFARLARERDYVRPEVVDRAVIELEASRHPVLEVDPRHQPFVPNDAGLDVEEDHLVLLTGPNMGGKSTYLRQVALIALMAHLGSWVPARRAVIGRVDRLFCRVGAGDSLMRGLSTFMVEMTETAAILRNATKASLVILDEVGRGTSTYDGMAIAWAVVEALAGPEGIGCRTLFATHYHELTQLGRSMGGVVNRTMGVREYAGKVHFLRTVEPGAADRSYGIHVAELAGVPQPVVARAWALLEDMESSRRALHPPATPGPKQESLFEDESFGAGEEILRVLRGLDLARTAPMEALLILDRLKKKAKSP